MDTLWQDLRFGMRMLRRRPAFAVLALLTLTLGIGVNTAIFSVLYSVLLKPLPYADSDSLVLVHGVSRDGSLMTLSHLDFQDLVAQSSAFEYACAIRLETLNLTGAGEPERLAAAGVTASLFNVFGVPPVLGRGFHPDEEKLGAPPVAVLSYGLWQRRFGGSEKVLGQAIELSGVAYTVIGVAAPNFQFPANVQIWKPLLLTPDELAPNQRGARYLRVIGRVKQGMTLEEARVRVEQVGADLSRKFPDADSDAGASITRLQNFLVRNVRMSLWVLLGAVAFVLLIACTNVANLFLVHTAQRESEVAVRKALGAGWGRILRQFLAEGLLLSASAGALGVLSALWLIDLLRSFGPDTLPRLQEVSIHGQVLMFTLCISIFAGLIVGVLPALKWAGAWRTTLRSAGRFTIGNSRTRAFLVAVEMALALILLAGAGLLIRSFAQLRQVDPGFRSSGVYSFGISLPDARYPELQQAAAFYSNLTHSLGQSPGVQSAAAIFGLPLSQGMDASGSFERSDRPKPPESNVPEAGFRIVTPDYFRVMAIAVRQGRTFRDSDGLNAPGVAVINEEAARRYWPGEDPVGKQLRMHISLVDLKNQPRTIVGVVSDVHFHGLDSIPEPEVFVPHAQQPIGVMMVVLRADPKLGGIEPMIRAEVKSLDPDLPIWAFRSMDDALDTSLAQRKFTMLLLASFAGLAVLLAAVGIYGVLSYTVLLRTREVGLRMAVGAARGDVFRMFFKEGVKVLFAGVLSGLIGGLAFSRILGSLLFNVPPRDPLTFALVAFLLCFIAMAAGFVPALRATRVDPMTALRYE